MKKRPRLATGRLRRSGRRQTAYDWPRPHATPAVFRHILQMEVAEIGPDPLAQTVPWAQPSDDEFDRCIPLLSAHRLYGLADLAGRRGYPFTSFQREQLAIGQQAATVTALMAERATLWIDDVLGTAGIDYRLTKGLATAHLVYDDPSIRQSADVDVFVGHDDLGPAVEALLTTGASRLTHDPRPGWDARFAKGIVMVTDDEVQIDLRRTMAVGSFGHRVDGSALMAGSHHRIELAGRVVPTLEPAALLVNACYRLLSWKRRLSTVRDIAQFAYRRPDLIAPALSLADQWRGMAAMIRAIKETERWIPLPPAVHQLAIDHPPSLADRLELVAYRPTVGKIAIRVEDMVNQSHWRDRGAYLAGLVNPTAEYRRHHGHPASQLGQRLLRPTRDRTGRG